MPITDLTNTFWLVKTSGFTPITSPSYYVNIYGSYYGDGYSTPFFKINFTTLGGKYYGIGTNIYQGSGTSFPKTSLLHNQLEFITTTSEVSLFKYSNRTQYYTYSGNRTVSSMPIESPSYTNGRITAARLIKITGGEDVTNVNLIAWLQENATQVTDVPECLANSKWLLKIKSELCSFYYATTSSFSIDNKMSYDGVESQIFSSLSIGSGTSKNQLYQSTSKTGSTYPRYAYENLQNSSCTLTQYTASDSSTSLGDVNVLLELGHGTDDSNFDLITWLYENATLIEASNSYKLKHIITNLTHGNTSFTITPDARYALPSSITVTNGTLISYDSTTGLIVVSGDDTTIISVECDETQQGYSGNITIEDYNGILAVETYIKFDTAPTSASDYDSLVDMFGTLTGLTSYSDKTKVYVWGTNSRIVINNNSSVGGTKTYDNAVEAALTGNYDIVLQYNYSANSGGSN